MKTQDASRVATEQQLRKGRFTSDVMLRLEGSINPGLEAQQLHLALTGDATQMSLVYVTMDACNGTIQYWPAQGGPPSWVSTVETSYTAGLFGTWAWHKGAECCCCGDRARELAPTSLHIHDPQMVAS